MNYASVECPQFEPTGSATHLPDSIRKRTPELRDPFHNLGLSDPARGNLARFALAAHALEPGQSMAVELNVLSTFRTVQGFERLGFDDGDPEGYNLKGLFPQYERSAGSFVTNASSHGGEIVDTNIEAYEGVVAVLGLNDIVPKYRDVLTGRYMNVPLADEGKFGTNTFLTPGGLDSRFIMTQRGWIGDDYLYYLGVKTSRPHGQDVSLYPQPTLQQYIAALREPPLGVAIPNI